MQPFTTFSSRVVSLPLDDIDTDQIIPARFLKVTNKTGLAANLFSDWRYQTDGTPKPEFVLNRPESQGSQILFAGNNFGCGSSREHAPWALTGFGFKAVIAISFGDIFRNNALKNGLLPIKVDKPTHQLMLDLLEEVPTVEWTIDLESQTLCLPNKQIIAFEVDSFSKTCLLKGTDELGYLLTFSENISTYELNHQKQVLE
jgi:3-isopropylmalate/(R)-2-methylmalate dehydratase small subunit